MSAELEYPPARVACGLVAEEGEVAAVVAVEPPYALSEAEHTDGAVEATGVVDEDAPVVDCDEEVVETVLH